MCIFTDNSFDPAGDFQITFDGFTGAELDEGLEQDLNLVMRLSRVDGGIVRLDRDFAVLLFTTGFPAIISGELVQNEY